MYWQQKYTPFLSHENILLRNSLFLFHPVVESIKWKNNFDFNIKFWWMHVYYGIIYSLIVLIYFKTGNPIKDFVLSNKATFVCSSPWETISLNMYISWSQIIFQFNAIVIPTCYKNFHCYLGICQVILCTATFVSNCYNLGVAIFTWLVPRLITVQNGLNCFESAYQSL